PSLDGTRPGGERRRNPGTREEARREGTKGSNRHSQRRPPRGDWGSAGGFHFYFHTPGAHDSARFIQTWRVLLERAHDQRQPWRVQFLLTTLRVEGPSGNGYGR